MPENNKGRTAWPWIVLGGLGLLFCGSILWSLWYETLLPLWRTGDRRGLLLHAFGVPLIFGGLGLFVYGGWILVRDTFRAFGDEEFAQDVEAVRQAGPGTDLLRLRWRNSKHLLGAWLPGALRMALGFGLLALGAYLINL